MPPQLSLRIDKGSETSSRKTTPEQVEADCRVLHEMIEDANRDRPPGASSDHGDLYDDFGAPR